ncbi:hypothetical protein LPJ61_002282 [Coemansia biformis]|uniref:PCI domain-containing protein n=1 Tax=Coemansia biformis TaxID=1286918 RepID=A0A9W7YFA8_9FUNG|nr:hypothetical protein LPJ61_002282 [Coemansia biformis]
MFDRGASHGGAQSAGGVLRPGLGGFELGECLGEYRGMGKLQRALYAAEHCPELSVNSLQLAMDEVKQSTYDAARYQLVAKQLARLTGSSAEDPGWLVNANHAASELNKEIAAKLDRARKQNSKRESFRAQCELVELLKKMGRMDEAIRALQDARAYCVDVGEQARLHLEVARIAQVMCRWLQVSSSIQRAESVVAEPSEVVAAELAAMQAQASFGDGKWAAAVGEIQRLSLDRLAAAGVIGGGVVTARDFALYGTLAGLAVLGRDRVKELLIDNVRFSQFLDHMPECQRLLQSFYGARYDDALQRLEQIKSFCLIDPVVGPHMAALQQQIVDNIVVLYTRPFVSIRMASMARALCFASEDALEATLVRMIEAGLIHARIDATTGILVKQIGDPRDDALRKVEKLHGEFSLLAELMATRIQYLEEESGHRPAVAGRR